MRKGVRHLFSTWGHVKNQRLTPTGITFLRHDPDWRPYYIPLQTRLTKRHSDLTLFLPLLRFTHVQEGEWIGTVAIHEINLGRRIFRDFL